MKLLQLPDGFFLNLDAVVFWEEIDAGNISKINWGNPPLVTIENKPSVVAYFTLGSRVYTQYLRFYDKKNDILRAWLDEWRSY